MKRPWELPQKVEDQKGNWAEGWMRMRIKMVRAIEKSQWLLQYKNAKYL